MLKKLFVVACFTIFAIFLSCSDDELLAKNGSINVAVLAAFPDDGNDRQSRATTYNRIFLRVLDDMDAIVRDTVITPSQDLILCGFANIPAQKEYRVIAWTQDAQGYIIHAPDTQAVFVETNANTNVILSLKPRVGSIIVQFAAVPSNISRFFMEFDSDSGKFSTDVPRATQTYIALNRVPYGATGTLSIRVQRTDGTFYIDWDTANFTLRQEDVYGELSFLQRDDMRVSISIRSPYNTVFTAFTDINNVLPAEKNIGVLITEFCVNGSEDADFVEVGNLSESVVAFNELRLVAIASSTLSITARNVVMPPMSTFVFGHHTAPNFWDNIDITGNLALVSTAATLLLYGDGELLDYVIYFNNNANSGWAQTASTGRRSWVLKELVADPKYNNFGGNWRLSTDTALVDDLGRAWLGTPGVLRQ
ncbi:MAG: hypothetical protein FWE23_07775 [Chitinivibrionia bacterium]|nr:hypothetical protein [Chitinivibrionia bacterium]